MSATAKHSPVGSFANVRYRGVVLKVTFIDAEPKTMKPKRARVQSQGPLQGTVLMPNSYEILEIWK